MKQPNTLVIAIALVSTLIACSRQGQGDRCLTDNNDADCESGLVCTPKEELRESELNPLYAADRCCPPSDGPKYTDSRCEPAGQGTPTRANGGSGGTTAGTVDVAGSGSTGTEATTAGASAAGSGA